MNCSVRRNLLNDFECDNGLNHVNQLMVGDEITFNDLEGNMVNGKIVKLKHKKDGSIEYKVKIND